MTQSVLQKCVLPFLCCLALLFSVPRIGFAADTSASNASVAPEAKKAMAQDDYSLTEPNQIKKPDMQVPLPDETIQYYAYLNLDTAEDALKPLIIAATFFRSVPPDWEAPVEFQELDLSYYKWKRKRGIYL